MPPQAAVQMPAYACFNTVNFFSLNHAQKRGHILIAPCRFIVFGEFIFNTGGAVGDFANTGITGGNFIGDEMFRGGKIYADGFYHTIVGDMIGYLEFAAGTEPKGCLGAGEFYAPTLPAGEALSFRSPLMDPSEVNEVQLISSPTLQRWFSHFKDQDIAV